VSALVLLGIPSYWEKVVVGAIIILAVTIDYYQRRKLLRQDWRAAAFVCLR